MMDQAPQATIAQEQVISQRLVNCGLDAKGISVKYEPFLQSIEVIIRPEAKANHAHFPCIRQAAENEIVTFADSATYTAYNEYAAEAERPQMLEMMRSALQERKLLEGFPERAKFSSLAEYAKALESHARVKPGSALRVTGDSIVFDPPRSAALAADFAAEYSALLSIVMFASVRDHIGFGFIGNEATSPPK